jgi:alkanesulfonate monooxygenase SsuD/methylene tetrahydromethanopterin reductase-like flavin-dependent oxidoreductase (luciferase family)
VGVITSHPTPSSSNAESRPAVSLVASATRRSNVLQLAGEAERRGFTHVACPSLGAAMPLCTSLAHTTSTLRYFTSIQPIYLSHPVEAANTAAHIHEISGGRFAFGIGVSHGPVVKRLGVTTGKPLSDIREYVAAMRANEKFSGELPPIYLATLRDKMLDLAIEIADGALWANASLRAIRTQLERIPTQRRGSFFMANMIPVVVSDDIEAARRVNRRTLVMYASLPNYRNYWRAAGHGEQVNAFERVLADTPRDSVGDALTSVMNDEWLDDCTISGPPAVVRDRLAAWWSTGVMPVAVMSAVDGGQAKGVADLFAVYS